MKLATLSSSTNSEFVSNQKGAFWPLYILEEMSLAEAFLEIKSGMNQVSFFSLSLKLLNFITPKNFKLKYFHNDFKRCGRLIRRSYVE
jgi:hypothetical protein